MPEKTRLIGQLGILFIVVAVLLALMDRQMLTGPETLAQWPFALLSLLLLAGLFGVVAVLVTHRLGALGSRNTELEQELATVRQECENNRNELEERVDRRTFEISVANASLNREIAERVNLSRHTVDTHIKRIYRKLAVSSRVTAVQQAKARGLLG